MKQFFRDNLMMLILLVAGWCVAFGYFQSEFTRMQKDAGNIQETRWIVDKHTQDISDLRADSKVNEKSINEIKSDIRVIAEWVREQKIKSEHQ
jgi:hypothetical protein